MPSKPSQDYLRLREAGVSALANVGPEHSLHAQRMALLVLLLVDVSAAEMREHHLATLRALLEARNLLSEQASSDSVALVADARDFLEYGLFKMPLAA